MTAEPREAFIDRLREVVALSSRLDRDDLPADVEPITDPERDVWGACALLHSALHRYGIAVRDEYWDLLLPSAATEESP